MDIYGTVRTSPAACAVIVGLCPFAACGIAFGWASAILAGAASAITYGLLRRHQRKAWMMRLDPGNRDHWLVHVNGVHAGQIPDSDYAAMRLGLLHDWPLLVTQLVELGRWSARVLGSVLLQVPVILVLISIFALYLDDSAAVESMVVTLREASGTDIAQMLRAAIELSAAIALISVTFSLMFVTNYGWVNHYGLQMKQLVRRHLKITADGDLSLTRVSQPGLSASSGAWTTD